MKKYIGILIVVLGIIIDQVTKVLAYNNSVNLVIIPNFLNFTLVENRGAAFGIAQGANLVLAIVSASICLLILGVIIYSIYKKEDISLAYYFILAGGIGNLIDRAFRGFVVDFIDTPFIATFNIADSFIVVGAFWVLISEVLKAVFKK